MQFFKENKLRISQVFNLNKSQAELDFIDIELETDISLFLDPHFLANKNDRWSQEATRTIRSFFQHLLNLLISHQLDHAKQLFQNLYEPNETCLGLSKRKPQGHGVGPKDTNKIFENILQSKAMKSGLVGDLEDFIIFVDNFNKDKLSDMTTNIIRMHLINYTQEQCQLWNIPLTSSIQSGPFWNKSANSWNNIYTEMLVIDSKRYLLVPKGVVSYIKEYTHQRFHRYFALHFLQQEHLRLNTALVQMRKRKDGSIERYVTKKSLIENELPGTKYDLNAFVEKHPQIFQDFKNAMKKPSVSLENKDFSKVEITEIAAFLKDKLIAIPLGHKGATQFHDCIIGILELLFYPELICPQKEHEIHNGRKRIDITFDNAARNGLFFELSKSLSCQFLFIECKNYKGDPKNPELDQLSGRFSPNRGKVGILVCREIDNLSLFCKRCSDTYKDDRGLILPLMDTDLLEVLDSYLEGRPKQLSEMLRLRRRNIQIN
ncbi:Uncharacterised protein [Legionella beliardensis]|uniref:Restriction endonuclease type IV Mrr domain-containing protein n=1 Tax=Legionella beliardensis TaxID=91822 RepID=A0A378I0G2_9GAMM|nr:hypothetical protein [Legionella beliardensis]STX28462.1 Uncharacterised protein [Legionella beliardensis]